MRKIDVLSIQRLGSAEKAKIEAVDAAVHLTECPRPAWNRPTQKRAELLGFARSIVAERAS